MIGFVSQFREHSQSRVIRGWSTRSVIGKTL